MARFRCQRQQQQEKGIEDSVEALARDILRPSNYSARQELVYTVAENATPVAEWLESMGVVWTLMDSLYYGQTEYRMLNREATAPHDLQDDRPSQQP